MKILWNLSFFVEIFRMESIRVCIWYFWTYQMQNIVYFLTKSMQKR